MSAFYHPLLESEEFKAIRKEWLEKQLGDWMPFNNDEYSGADDYMQKLKSRFEKLKKEKGIS